MKKIFILLLFAASHSFVYAQFNSVLLRVDGLTCSACSFATQQSILKLDFVEDVKIDLNSHDAIVTFKQGKKISIDQIAKKVYDAGFSVGNLRAKFTFNSNNISDSTCFEYAGDIYHFEQLPAKTVLNGIATIQFIGKKYMSIKEYKK